jgi:hypothetical protein
MEASTSRPRVRLIVVDFLATLFVTFCIGVATAVVLGACVMLMAGDAHGAEVQKPVPVTDLVLAHYVAAKYSGLIAVDRASAIGPR